MLITRLAKILMCLALAVFCLLVAYDNIADYGTNYVFVQHVLSMDTAFPGNELLYRSITDPLVWKIAYALIIAAEGLTGVLFLRGVIRAWDTTNVLMLALVVTYCIDLSILSQASMEARHKTGLMPLMYIVVAYGARYRQRDAVILGLLFSFGFGAMVLLYNGYKLWNL